MKKFNLLFFFLLMILSTKINAQKKQINWITFEQLEDSLAIQPKKVFISFYADWCVYCKKMNRVAFKNTAIVDILNREYYAVKLNAETKEIIVFDGIEYRNKQLGKSRKPTHDIPLLLASRQGKPFSLPANIILDQNFNIEKRSFEYLSSKKLFSFLSKSIKN